MSEGSPICEITSDRESSRSGGESCITVAELVATADVPTGLKFSSTLTNDGLLVCDLWEHAYMVDYLPAEKKDYVSAFFDNLNWKTVEERFVNAVA